ncbi:MAG TPA: DUF2914 domain-containing protein [Candidatus Paceibacterota bacterium]|nr:DUF2914 domain-containing protein [Candidatus Paceibacterota bacterium]
MFRKVLSSMKTYERHLSAVAMIAGFAWDNVFFGRVDLWQTQAVFAVYAAICFISIPLLHALAARGPLPRWSVLLPLSTQFALGGFWSGFVIFYGRSADIGASWPFLLALVLVLLGSEYFHQYHERLVFTAVLFFFALYSYAIFAVPLLTGTVSVSTFVISTLVAILGFGLFTIVLRVVARERFLADIWRIRVGAAMTLAVFLLAYAANILPPLPLSEVAGGVYHSVWRVPGAYLASEEPQPWRVTYLGFAPTLHLLLGDSVSAYSSIFAPAALSTSIVHEWQWYDAAAKRWITKAVITYPISGGRDGGYRGYSTIAVRQEGKWRVNIETSDGRLIDRLPFTVVASAPPPLSAVTLK